MQQDHDAPIKVDHKPNQTRPDQTRIAHLLIDIGDVLLALPVHIEDLKKGFVNAFVICKARLRGYISKF